MSFPRERPNATDDSVLGSQQRHMSEIIASKEQRYLRIKVSSYCENPLLQSHAATCSIDHDCTLTAAWASLCGRVRPYECSAAWRMCAIAVGAAACAFLLLVQQYFLEASKTGRVATLPNVVT